MNPRKNIKTDQRQSTASLNRRNFIAGLWHGAFMALGVSLTQPTIVISAFVADLTGSTIWVGGLMTVLTVAGVIPQLFVARLIEPRPKKMPYLLIAIYLRVISWGILAWSIYVFSGQNPMALAGILVGMLIIFNAGGGPWDHSLHRYHWEDHPDEQTWGIFWWNRNSGWSSFRRRGICGTADHC